MTPYNSPPGHADHASTTVNEATVKDLDLTPFGLADAPANEQDAESIVYTGNS